MSTSATSALSKPEGINKISTGTLAYIRARNKHRTYNLVIREFKKSGLTQADLAKRLGKAPEVISRLLARPRNWEMDTFSDLLFAISGAVPRYELDRPLDAVAPGISRARIGLESSTVSNIPNIPKVRSNNPNIALVTIPPVEVRRGHDEPGGAFKFERATA